MLAAWNDGIGSSPNNVKDLEGFERVLSMAGGTPATILTLGYPARPVVPEKSEATAWIAAADRKPLSEVVVEFGR